MLDSFLCEDGRGSYPSILLFSAGDIGFGRNEAERGPVSTVSNLPENFKGLCAIAIGKVPIADAVSLCHVLQRIGCALRQQTVCRKLAFVHQHSAKVGGVLNNFEIFVDRLEQRVCIGGAPKPTKRDVAPVVDSNASVVIGGDA